MKIIDLLNKIANGEEVPKNVIYKGFKYEFSSEDYYDEENDELLFRDSVFDVAGVSLNDEVEIIEEKPTQEETKEYTNKFLEAWIPVKKQFGKLFDEIASIGSIGNVLDLEDELEEEKKIPEKIELEPLNLKDNLQRQIEVVHYENIMISNAVNEIIDFFKSKGDE